MLVFDSELDNQFQKAYHGDAGYDLIASIPMVVPAWGKALVPTGLTVAIPDGFAGIIKSRSGLAVKHDLEVGAGVIDSEYRGEVKVLLRNFSDIDYTIDSGDKVAQLVVTPIYMGEVDCGSISKETSRGDNGFNSTGYKNG